MTSSFDFLMASSLKSAGSIRNYDHLITVSLPQLELQGPVISTICSVLAQVQSLNKALPVSILHFNQGQRKKTTARHKEDNLLDSTQVQLSSNTLY